MESLFNDVLFIVVFLPPRPQIVAFLLQICLGLCKYSICFSLCELVSDVLRATFSKSIDFSPNGVKLDFGNFHSLLDLRCMSLSFPKSI